MWYAGKYSKLSVTEEEQCEDLLLFLKLLSHLTTKDYLNFAPDDESAGPAVKVEPVDVVVTGINIVLPLMSEETLKVCKYLIFESEINYSYVMLVYSVLVSVNCVSCSGVNSCVHANSAGKVSVLQHWHQMCQ